MTTTHPLVGTFTIGVHRAEKLHSKSNKKSNPYVIIRGPKKQYFKTLHYEDSGNSPVWDERFNVVFPQSTRKDKKPRVLKIEVWDQRPLKDHWIGTLRYNPDELLGFSNSGVQWHTIKSKHGQPAGNLSLDFAFTPGLGIQVVECKELQKKQEKNTYLLNNYLQRPYVFMKIGTQSRRTKVDYGVHPKSFDFRAGVNPKWNDEIHYFAPLGNGVDEKGDYLKIQVYDEGRLIDSVIGEARIAWDVLWRDRGGGEKSYQLYNKGGMQERGLISLRIMEINPPQSYRGPEDQRQTQNAFMPQSQPQGGPINQNYQGEPQGKQNYQDQSMNVPSAPPPINQSRPHDGGLNPQVEGQPQGQPSNQYHQRPVSDQYGGQPSNQYQQGQFQGQVANQYPDSQRVATHQRTDPYTTSMWNKMKSRFHRNPPAQSYPPQQQGAM